MGNTLLLMKLFAGIPLVENIVASVVFDKISKCEIEELFRDCIYKAISYKRELLKQYSSGLAEVGENDPYLDEKQLFAFLSENVVSKPLLEETSGNEDSWDTYLEYFSAIIVIPDCTLEKSDHLELIKEVLDLASEYFSSTVPCKHPAFEEFLLEHIKKNDSDHRQITEKLEEMHQDIKKKDNSNSTKPLLENPEHSEMQNPFSSVAADDIHLANKEHIKDLKTLFISRHTDLPAAKKHFNSILEGQRGTGKTMILKYLSFQAQIYIWLEDGKGSSDGFFSHSHNFIGIYTKLGQNVYDKSDFENISSDARRDSIFEHRLTLQLLHSTTETLESIFEYGKLPESEFDEFKEMLTDLLGASDRFEKTNNIHRLFQKVKRYIDTVLVVDVDKHLSSISFGNEDQFPAFNPWLKLSSLHSFLRNVRELCSIQIPFFLILDDFDVLRSEQQSCVMKMASQRDLTNVCYKFGIMVLGQKTGITGSGRTFRSSGDYEHIDLDWTEGGLHEKYYEIITEIAGVRLEAAGWPKCMTDILPVWEYGHLKREEIKNIMASEWDCASEDNKPTVKKSDFFSKYGNARYFQYLRGKKIHLRYAGFDDIMMVSSGIFRQFLEVNYHVFNHALNGGLKPGGSAISAEIQDKAIREYSESMIRDISKTAGDADVLLSGKTEITSQHMMTLIHSFSDLFYSRLHAANHGEPEIICIAIRDELSEHHDAEAYLNIAVRESILHRFEYPPKTAGGAPLKAFMLNRRLGPRRNLSISRMQGRIEISCDDLLLAVSDRKAFIERIQNRKGPPPSPQMKFPKI